MRQSCRLFLTLFLAGSMFGLLSSRAAEPNAGEKGTKADQALEDKKGILLDFGVWVSQPSIDSLDSPGKKRGKTWERDGKKFVSLTLIDDADKIVAEVVACYGGEDIDIQLSGKYPMEFTVVGRCRWIEDVASGRRLQQTHTFAPGSYRIKVKKASNATTQKAESAGR